MRELPRMLLCSGTMALAVLTAACSDDELDSDEEARRAYLALDPSIAKSLQLGFDGFNSATSANIAPQTTNGVVSGTLTITGQVDQGSSDNKGMRLYVGMVKYVDVKEIEYEGDTIDVNLTYDTSTVQTEQPYLVLQLRNIPSGTFTGTLTGVYRLTGDIEADINVNLTMSGTLQDAGGGKTMRAPGSTTVTGTATSGDGTYDVNITI